MISQNQSGFKPGDSCINQLLAITHKIYKSFEACLDVRVVFRHLKSIQQGLAPVFSFQVEAEQCLLETLNLSLNAKLFADKALPFPVVHDITTFSCNLNYDLNSKGLGFSVENEL